MAKKTNGLGCVLMFAVICAFAPVAAHPMQASNSAQSGVEEESVTRTTNATAQRDAILEAKEELEAAAFSRLEVGLAFFAVFLGVIIIYFSLKTKDIAVAEARKEIGAERDQIEAVRREMITIRDKAADLLSQVKADSAQISQHLNSVATETLGTGTASPTEIDTISRAATALRQKSPRELDGGDVAILLADADIQQDWPRVHDLAVLLRQLFSEPQWQSLALFAEGLAASKLRTSEEAIAIYDKVIEKFGDSSDDSTLVNVAKAHFNRAVRLGSLKKHDDELAGYDAMLALYAKRANKAVQRVVNKALFNKSVTLADAGRHKEAINSCEELIEGFSDSSDHGCLENVAGAMLSSAMCHSSLGNTVREMEIYTELVRRFAKSSIIGVRSLAEIAQHNFACQLALEEKPEECAAALEKSAALFGGLDLERIRDEKDFDSVRAHPAFVAVLAAHPGHASSVH